jgi:hypothetical protein
MTTFCIDFYESNLSTGLADSSDFFYTSLHMFLRGLFAPMLFYNTTPATFSLKFQ